MGLPIQCSTIRSIMTELRMRAARRHRSLERGGSGGIAGCCHRGLMCEIEGQAALEEASNAMAKQ